MPRRLAIVLTLGAAVLALLAAFWFTRGGGEQQAPGAMAGPPPPRVETTPATRRDIAVTVRAVGSVEAAESIVVTSQVTGKVTEILFTEGQRVQQDDVLVRLDSGREEADLQAARAEYRDARRQLRRLRELVEQRTVPESEVDTAQARLESARAGVAEAQAALDERRITAPFAGVIGLRKVSPGSLIQPGDPVTTLATLDRLHVGFQVPSDILPRLRTGMEVRARVPGIDESFSGRVTSIDNTVDPATRAIALEADLPGAGALRPGIFVTIDLVLETRNAVVVPEQALVLEGRQAYVYVVDEGGIVERKAVTTGERRPGIVEIREGLEAGTQVVTAGVQKVRVGQTVRLEGRAPPAGGPGAGPPP
jgi:membrane fusion protein (multidrug efflux system)